MNLEDIAKQDLMEFQMYQPANLYDPYRKRNMLKDSNNSEWASPVPPAFHTDNSKAKQSSKLKRYSCKEKECHESDRHSLKMLLMKLQATPSPQTRKKDRKITKLKTIGEISSTQCVAIVRKNRSILIKLDSQNKVDEYTQEKYNFQKLQRPITTQKRPKTKLKNISESFRPHEQQRVRMLIKQKLAEKQKKQEKEKAARLLDPKLFGSNRVF